MKKIFFILAFIFTVYVFFSAVYIISGPDYFSECYSRSTNYKDCLSIQYIDYFIKFPGMLVSRYTPIHFIWGDIFNNNTSGIRIGTYTFGGLRIGNHTIFQTWQKGMPI